METSQKILVLFNIKHPYDRKIVDGILEALHHSNQNLQTTFMTYDEALLVASDTQWHGIIADFDYSRNAELCARLNTVTVGLMSNQLNFSRDQFPALVNVLPNSDLICKKAVDHFKACGVKNLGYFSGTAHEFGFWSDERKINFHKYVNESGLNWIGDYNTYSIREHLIRREFLHAGYFCASDTQARQLITLAGNLKISVPGHISVIGVDNDEVENQLSQVPISSVTLDPCELGKKAFFSLTELMQDNQSKNILVPPGEVVNRLSAYLDVGDDALVAQALKFIYLNVHRPIKAEQVISHSGTSRNTLENRFRKILDKTIHQVLHEVRIENAKEMLAKSDKSIDDISLQCGLSSPQYLYYLFRKEVGMTPSQYRELKSKKLEATP